ncbi:hypothetical protein [Eilatimonas milleporae]|uniref:Uncharacterized protein n=1 Tax=Eilatimonas milleporae TaxID=911205 RepID=A0A3M0CE39_9PROT|nr:hypothetical protein [Eilatimonas milleporae]RMB05006.1 hypothetical protein BXY39_2584 [Eilatimonas milleporae]
MNHLYLDDYASGYGFETRCRTCGHQARESHTSLCTRPDVHGRLTLEDVSERLTCPYCKTRAVRLHLHRLTPVHHFIAGMP